MTQKILIRKRNKGPCHQLHFASSAAALLISLVFMGCSSVGGLMPNPVNEKRPLHIQDAASLKPAELDIALRENQAALTDGQIPRDIALYNIGILSLSSANPKKDWGRAIASFKRLVNDYPQSPQAEAARAWIQVLNEMNEERRKLAEERRVLSDEKHKVAEERRILARERENLSQERDKLKYVIERSGQIDLEIEKRRKQTRAK
jgi:hypothetical protein